MTFIRRTAVIILGTAFVVGGYVLSGMIFLSVVSWFG